MSNSFVKFKHKSSSAELVVAPDGSARLRNVYSGAVGKGHASELLQKIVEYVDANNLTVTLTVQRNKHPDNRALNNIQLARFYKKFGFAEIPYEGLFVIMQRKPQSRESQPL